MDLDLTSTTTEALFDANRKNRNRMDSISFTRDDDDDGQGLVLLDKNDRYSLRNKKGLGHPSVSSKRSRMAVKVTSRRERDNENCYESVSAPINTNSIHGLSFSYNDRSKEENSAFCWIKLDILTTLTDKSVLKALLRRLIMFSNNFCRFLKPT